MVFYLILLLLFPCNFVFAKPYIPKDNSQIIEKLPGGQKQLSYDLRILRDSLNKNQKDLKLTINFAKKCIEISRDESDPRYLGYAEGVLKPWLKEKETPAEILVLAGIIKQSNHDFSGALDLINQSLEKDSSSAQAWITKAQILQVTGDYENSKRACIPLLRLTGELSSISCLSGASSLSGSGEKSYSILKKTVDKSVSDNLDEKVWAFNLLAEIAERLGKLTESDYYFKEALSLKPNDVYLLTSYSDFLLRQNKQAQVISLLKDKTNIDGLLLRLAIAEKGTGSNLAKEHTSELDKRFKASQKRGDSIHLREEAILNLKLLNNKERALDLASKNWLIQKEPIDAEIVLETAIANKNKLSAKEIIDFLQIVEAENVYLDKLLKKVGEI